MIQTVTGPAESGLPLFAHGDVRARPGLKLLEVFEKQRFDPERIVIGHVGDSHDPAYVGELLIPELRKLGFGDRELEQLLAANPRRILS